jgi:hypothetical protein
MNQMFYFPIVLQNNSRRCRRLEDVQKTLIEFSYLLQIIVQCLFYIFRFRNVFQTRCKSTNFIFLNPLERDKGDAFYTRKNGNSLVLDGGRDIVRWKPAIAFHAIVIARSYTRRNQTRKSTGRSDHENHVKTPLVSTFSPA